MFLGDVKMYPLSAASVVIRDDMVLLTVDVSAAAIPVVVVVEVLVRSSKAKHPSSVCVVFIPSTDVELINAGSGCVVD